MKCASSLSALFLLFTAAVEGFARPYSAWVKPIYFGHGPEKCEWKILYDHDFVNDKGTKVKFIGNIMSNRHKYSIYFHDHLYFSNYRETRNLIVLKDGCKYVGVYTVPADPVRIRGNDIIFNAPKKYGNVIHFSKQGPPPYAWIDGENPEFAR